MRAPRDRQESEPSTLRCSACSARLAHDQRYCIECGARRGHLPSWLAEIVGTIHEQGAIPVRPAPKAARRTEGVPRPKIAGITMPDPRAIAVAVMGLLSFGVIVGSLASPTIASLATAPIVLVTGGAVNPAGSGGADQTQGSGGGGTRTITITSPSSTPAPSASASPSLSSAGTGSVGGGTGGTPSPGFLGLPPVKHVFLIMLTDHGFGQTFSPASPDAYLSKTLPRKGELVEFYYGVAASSLANEIALLSGQGPTVQTNANCPVFKPVAPAIKGPQGQVIGAGCVYPARVQTLPDQLTADHLTWRAYVQSMAKSAKGKQVTCRRPRLGASDADQAPRPTDPYVTSSNPFVYFLSLTKGKACSQDDLDLTHLSTDLKSESTTPSFAYIAPSPCDNGSEQPCRPHATAGLAAADGFLKSIVPMIKKSAAYKDSGLIAITFDHAPQSGTGADSTSCCSNPSYPNLPPATTGTGGTTAPGSTTTPTGTGTTPGTTTPTATTPTTPTSTGTGTPGGGQVGLMLISSYVKPGTTDVIDYYNHFSLLGSIENLFGLKRIAYAHDPQLPVFDPALFNGP